LGAALNIDLRIHFVKASGATSAKVFKVRESSSNLAVRRLSRRSSHCDSKRLGPTTRASPASRRSSTAMPIHWDRSSSAWDEASRQFARGALPFLQPPSNCSGRRYDHPVLDGAEGWRSCS
jgi:hypothetical protein